MGFFDGIFKPAKNQKRAYGQAMANYDRGTRVADEFYKGGINRSNKALGQYDDAIGLNGAVAQKSFRDAFMTGPGFDASMEAGVGAIDQSAVAGGIGQSGKTLGALQTYGQNQYANEFDAHLNRLRDYGGQGYQSAGGVVDLVNGKNNLVLGNGQVRDQGNAAKMGNFTKLLSFGAGRVGF